MWPRSKKSIAHGVNSLSGKGSRNDTEPCQRVSNTSLNGYLSGNKARVNCFVPISLSLIAIKIVLLQAIAPGFASPAQVSSWYRRRPKLFAWFDIDFVVIARWPGTLSFADKDSYLSAQIQSRPLSKCQQAEHCHNVAGFYPAGACVGMLWIFIWKR